MADLPPLPIAMALIGPDGRFAAQNPAHAALFGDALGHLPAALLAPQDAVEIEALGRRGLAGEAAQHEGWMQPGQHPARFLRHACLPQRDTGGAVTGCLVVVLDVTDSQAALETQTAALRRTEAVSAAVTASALDCVVVIDEAGHVVEFNPAAEHTFGHSRAAVLGQPIGDVIVPHHLRARHAHGFARYLVTGQAHVLGRRIEIEGLRANGEIFPVELAITEVRLPGQRLFTAHLRDLTAAHAAAEELRRSHEALHQSEKMAAFGSLLAGVAHELNNPLSIVIGNATMLAEDAAEAAPALAGRAAKIHAAAERCGRIVRSFLAMARQRPASSRAFALGPVIHAAVELLAYGLRTTGVIVRTEIADALPDAIGDPDQLHQVLTNLITNAQQALADRAARRITITAGVDAQGLVVSVADNGPGVPAAIRNRIFDPFFTTKPIGEGTGIGLAVSRGIVEAYGGRLTLADAPGGARFDLRLQSAVAQAPAIATATPEHAPASRRALIIDDEPEVAAVLAQMALRLGVSCDICDGTTACAALEAREFDVIFCDLHMPGLDGATLFAWLGARLPHLRERVVFITADTLGQSAMSFLARAGRPVLEKPFAPDELRRVLAPR